MIDAPANLVSVRPGGVLAELRLLSRLALPIGVAQAGFALMGLVDTAVVGRLGAGPLGAVGLSNGLFLAVAVLGIGVMAGLDPLLSQALGARDGHRARELLWQGLWLAILVSLVLAVPILLLPLLLAPAKIPPAVASEARAFLWLRLPGLLPMLLFAALRAYLQARARVRVLVWSTVIANVGNLLLDLLFVFGGATLPSWTWPLDRVPALGARGSALATCLCSVLQVLILVPAVRALLRDHREGGERDPSGASAIPPALEHRTGYRTEPGGGDARSARSDERPVRRGPRLDDLRRALRVGLPVGLQMTAEVAVFALVGLLAGHLGEESLAAHQVAIALASFTFCFAMGIGNAGSVRVGWAVGARDPAAVRLSGLCAFGAGASFMALSAICFWLFPGALASLISDRPEVIQATMPLLAVTAVFQISDGVQGVGAGVLRGAGDTRFPFLANLFGHYAVGLPVAIVLGFGLSRGIFGLWWGLCAGLSAVALLLFLRFLRLSSRPIEPLEAHTSLQPPPH